MQENPCIYERGGQAQDVDLPCPTYIWGPQKGKGVLNPSIPLMFFCDLEK